MDRLTSASRKTRQALREELASIQQQDMMPKYQTGLTAWSVSGLAEQEREHKGDCDLGGTVPAKRFGIPTAATIAPASRVLPKAGSDVRRGGPIMTDSYTTTIKAASVVGFKPLARASGSILLQVVGITSPRFAVLCRLDGQCIELQVERLRRLKNGDMFLQLEALPEGLTGLAEIEVAQECGPEVHITQSVPVLLTHLEAVALEISSFKSSCHNPSLQQMRWLAEDLAAILYNSGPIPADIQLCAKLATYSAAFGWKRTLTEVITAATKIGSLASFLQEGGPDLLCAAVQSRSWATTNMVLSLLRKANHWEAVTSVAPTVGVTALHVAAQLNDPAILKLVMSCTPGAQLAWTSVRAGPMGMTPSETFTKLHAEVPASEGMAVPVERSHAPSHAEEAQPSGPKVATECSHFSTSSRSTSHDSATSSEQDAPCMPSQRGLMPAATEADLLLRDMPKPLLVKCLGERSASMFTPLSLILIGSVAGGGGSELPRIGCLTVILTLMLHIVVPFAYRKVRTEPAVSLRMAANYVGLTLDGFLVFRDPDIQHKFENSITSSRVPGFAATALIASSLARWSWTLAALLLIAACSVGFLSVAFACETYTAVHSHLLTRQWINAGLSTLSLAVLAAPSICAAASGSHDTALPGDLLSSAPWPLALLAHSTVLTAVAGAQATLLPAPMQGLGVYLPLNAAIAGTFSLSLCATAEAYHGLLDISVLLHVFIAVCAYSLSYFCCQTWLEMWRVRRFVTAFPGHSELSDTEVISDKED